MKIIHIEDFFHADAGYQINILPKYMVKQGHEVTIITSEMEKVPDYLTNFFGNDSIEDSDKKYMKETGVKIVRLPLKGYISGRAIFKSDIYKIIEALTPDILYVHGNDTFTGMRFLKNYKKLKIPMVMDSHMLEMASKNRLSKIFRLFYKFAFTPIIKKHEIKVIRTQNDDYVKKHLGIPLTLCPWISVGSDTLLFYPNADKKNKFRAKNNIPNKDFVVIYTGKLDEAKGGRLLAKTFEKKIKNNKNLNLTLLIVGNSSGPYGKEIEKTLKKSENTIIRFPTQIYKKLPEFYQAADLSIFPKQCSLSFYDAQACGLPVLSEDNNINKERLKDNNGTVFMSGNSKNIREKIKMFMEMDKAEYESIKENSVRNIKEKYDYENITNEYMEVITSEFQRFNHK